MSDPRKYTVGWICAVATEYVAAQEFLDEEHDGPEHLPPPVRNDYALGKMGRHNVVIATLPMGEYGIASAARVAEEMQHAFPNIRIGLMVGIGGGVPTRHDIRLGDVVVSIPLNGLGGVLQYDFGKTEQNKKFQRTGFLDQPPTVLRTAVGGLKVQYERKGHRLEEAVEDVLIRNRRLRSKYKRPDPVNDRLYRSDHTGEDSSFLIRREERDDDVDNPMIHYGLIASANQLMKDATVRDKLAEELDVLCFEMEAAGLMNNFPCLVIRGICDYSDSHKNKDWQGYAAMVAAAYAKDLLSRIVPSQVEAETKMSELQSTVNANLEETKVISSGVSELRESEEDHALRAIAAWLTPINYAVQQSDFINRRQKETGTWFLASDEFQAWLTQPEKYPTLFCPGIPGAGKTMISSITISHLQNHFHQSTQVGIAYIFCNFSQQDILQNPTALIASLVRQLSKGEHAEPLRELFKTHDKKNTYPSHMDLFQVLVTVVSSYSRVFILVDALDEFHALQGRESFLRDLFALQQKVDMHMSIFATSRYGETIESFFRGCSRRVIRANEADVRMFLDGKLHGFQPWVSNNFALKNDIKTKLSEAADGMFLLAKLYIDALLCETTPKGIKTILTELENISKSSADGEERKRRALDHAYEAAMRRIQSQPSGHYELAKRVLSWIVCAKQDLSPLQLQHAVAIEINSRTLDEDNIADIGLSISVCAGLMTIHKESNVVKPVHYTTQEYFERTWQDWFPDSYVYLTKACITYISLQVFDSGECASKDDLRDRYEDYPFYQYSGQHWGSYAKDTSMETDPLVLDLLQSTTRLAAITQAFQVVFYEMDYSTGYTTEMNGLHVAAHFGLYESLSILLGGTLDIDSKDRIHHRSSLFWAANHKEVVNLLLDSGADIEFQDRRQLTPLIHAAGKGHKSVVQLLIDRGANINSENSFHDTPLTSAITQRHEDVAMLLVNSEVDFQSKTGHESSLNSAVRYGLEGLVRLILTKGVDVNSKNGSGETPLFAAIRYQRKSLVELLLHRAADVNSKSNSGCTPLFQAIMYEEDLSVLRLLLQHGADTNPEYDDSNLLEFAIWHGRTDVVRLFLHEGICLDSPGRALANAAEAGHVEPVKLLLDAGTDIESRSTYNKTWDEAANMFTMRTSFNQTALSLAARNGRQDVVRLLLDRGADIESKNTYGFNPLCLAVLNGDESMARLLLSGGAQIESRAGSSQTPLLLAASQGFEEIVELLLSLNAQVEARDIHGFTPLILAATEGHYFVVQLILEHGARVNARANEGQTALLQAIARSHVDVVGLLLKRGANLKMNGLQKRVSPLGLALEKGKKPIVSLIRKKLSEISSSTDTGSESGSENPASTSLLKTGTSLGSSSKNTSQTSLSRSSQGPGGSKSGMALVLADPNSDTDSSAAYEKRGLIQAPRRHASNFLDPNLHVKSPRPASYSHSRQESAGTHSSSTRPRRRRRRRHDKETGVGERSNSIHSDGEETSQTLEGKSTGTDGSKRVRDAQTRPQRKLFGIFRVK